MTARIRDEVLDTIFEARIVSAQDADAETQRLIAGRARRTSTVN